MIVFVLHYWVLVQLCCCSFIDLHAYSSFLNKLDNFLIFLFITVLKWFQEESVFNLRKAWMGDSFPSILISCYPGDGTVSDLVMFIVFCIIFFPTTGSGLGRSKMALRPWRVGSEVKAIRKNHNHGISLFISIFTMLPSYLSYDLCARANSFLNIV